MARVFYSTGQFDKAAKYYDKIPLESSLWLDALFEASWTFPVGTIMKKPSEISTL